MIGGREVGWVWGGRCVVFVLGSRPISHRFCSLEHIPRILLGFVPHNLQRRLGRGLQS